jgi:hypothetical protein
LKFTSKGRNVVSQLIHWPNGILDDRLPLNNSFDGAALSASTKISGLLFGAYKKPDPPPAPGD